MRRVSIQEQFRWSAVLAGILTLALLGPVSAQVVQEETIISHDVPSDHFGVSIAALGDLNGDGIGDYAVGAPGSDSGGRDAGAVYLLFMAGDGSVASRRTIDATTDGIPPGAIQAGDAFGTSVSALSGLLNFTLAVGAPGVDDDSKISSGAVWLLRIDSDGAVTATVKLSAAAPVLRDRLASADLFGRSVVPLGDLDGDGTEELAVGAPGTEGETGRMDTGAVYLLSLGPDGTISRIQSISDTEGTAGGGGITGLAPYDHFGYAVAAPGDLNGDGQADLLAGAPFAEPNGGQNRGRLHVLYLDQTGQVTESTYLDDAPSTPLAGQLSDDDMFAGALSTPSDGATVPSTVAVGAAGMGEEASGGVWSLTLASDGAIKVAVPVVPPADGTTSLEANDMFGFGVALPGRAPGYGAVDLVAGGPYVDEDAPNAGSMRTLALDDAVLPVELVAFTARASGTDVLLSWETASETNNAGFEIEHAVDTGSFETRGFVAGKGTSSHRNQYAYRVDDLAPARHVFRLKQMDTDGAFAYSSEVEVQLGMAGRFVLEPVYPNPFRTTATVRFAVKESVPVRMMLYNMLGQVVKVVYAGVPASETFEEVEIDGHTLPSGLYMLRLLGPGMDVTEKVILLK